MIRGFFLQLIFLTGNSFFTQVWDYENVRLWRWYELKTFDEQADAAESWLSAKEACLSIDDLGDSMGTVENLLKKHDGFETALSAQSDKIDKLNSAADTLVGKNDEHKDHVIRYSMTYVYIHKDL